jgi:hypothetical protein
MAKLMDVLFDATSTGGGNLDTGVLRTTQYEGLQIALTVTSATTGAVNVYVADVAGNTTQVSTIASAAVGSYLYTFFPGGSSTAPSMSAFPGPGNRVTVTGATTSVARLVVYGVRSLVGAN